MTTSNLPATARACSNIAFIKYWGNIDHDLRLPANSSISMNLHDLFTTTTVTWGCDLDTDTLWINGAVAETNAQDRVSKHLDIIRERLGIKRYAKVESENNFPMGTGIASSASSFAALTLASIKAAGADLSEREISTIARRGSGSASRSIPSGFVEWHYGETHESSYAETFVENDYWDLVDVIAIVSDQHKKTGSSKGHTTADTSVLQSARVQSAPERLANVKQAIQQRDFELFARVVEEDSNLMHSIMMTSRPPLFYWQPLTLEIMHGIMDLRAQSGIQACYTLDAGPNVHCICIRNDSEKVISYLRSLSDTLDVRVSSVGKGAYILDSDT